MALVRIHTQKEEVYGHLLYFVQWQKYQVEQANYCVLPISCLFSNFPDAICVEQLSASTMMLEAQFTEILVRQNAVV